jgi:hypothetical protein
MGEQFQSNFGNTGGRDRIGGVDHDRDTLPSFTDETTKYTPGRCSKDVARLLVSILTKENPSKPYLRLF